MEDQGWDVTLFFYNPNLHPQAEHEKRLEEAKAYSGSEGLPLLSTEADFEGWDEATKIHADAPEGGPRCEICFTFRLSETARIAAAAGIEAFASTLSLSPHKKPALIDGVGFTCAGKFGVEYIPTDFKKKDGFSQSVRLSREHGLYRQDYCGCKYSLRGDHE